MLTTVVPAGRFDAIDREKFEEMIRSESFKVLQDRIDHELTRSMSDCENLAEPREIYRAQGTALALRMVAGLPARILAEMAARQKLR